MIKRACQKTKKPQSDSKHPAKCHQDQDLSFSRFIKNPSNPNSLKDTLATLNRYQIFLISPLQSYHTPPSQSPTRPPNPIKEAAHRAFSEKYTLSVNSSKPSSKSNYYCNRARVYAFSHSQNQPHSRLPSTQISSFCNIYTPPLPTY